MKVFQIILLLYKSELFSVAASAVSDIYIKSVNPYFVSLSETKLDFVWSCVYDLPYSNHNLFKVIIIYS